MELGRSSPVHELGIRLGIARLPVTVMTRSPPSSDGWTPAACVAFECHLFEEIQRVALKGFRPVHPVHAVRNAIRAAGMYNACQPRSCRRGL